jgi:hypothetical protein
MAIQVLGDCYNITRTAALDQGTDCGKYESMILAVKIISRNNVGDLVPGQRVEHQATNQGLLGFYGGWRNLEALLSASLDPAIVHRSDHSIFPQPALAPTLR